MERTRYFLVLLLLVNFGVNAQTNSQKEIFQAYIAGDMVQWKIIMDELKSKNPIEEEQLLELINYEYGYIGWCLGQDKKSEAKEILEQAEIHIGQIQSKSHQSYVSAYKSAFIAFRIGINPIRATYLGPKSLEKAKSAIALDESNYLGHLLLANNLYFMPLIFGGSKEEALKLYLKSLKVLEANYKQSYLKTDWNYISLLITIGNAFKDLERIGDAKQYYTRVLHIAPDFKWVKDELILNLKE